MVLEDGKYYPILKAYTGKQEMEENSAETPYSAWSFCMGGICFARNIRYCASTWKKKF